MKTDFGKMNIGRMNCSGANEEMTGSKIRSGIRVVYQIIGALLLSLGLLQSQVMAQLRIDITEGQVAPTPIAIANFTGPNGEVTEIGKQIARVISEDLESSGLFAPVDSAAFIDPPSAISAAKFQQLDPAWRQGIACRFGYIDASGMLQVEFVLWDVVINVTLPVGEAMPIRWRYVVFRIRSLILFMRNLPAIPVILIHGWFMSPNQVQNRSQAACDYGSGWAQPSVFDVRC